MPTLKEQILSTKKQHKQGLNQCLRTLINKL